MVPLNTVIFINLDERDKTTSVMERCIARYGPEDFIEYYSKIIEKNVYLKVKVACGNL